MHPFQWCKGTKSDPTYKESKKTLEEEKCATVFWQRTSAEKNVGQRRDAIEEKPVLTKIFPDARKIKKNRNAMRFQDVGLAYA